MNKAAADRINAKNQFKRDYARYKDDFKKGWTDYDAITQSGYKSYSDNYDSTLKTNAINGYTAVLSSGLFSGEGIEGYEAAEGASVGAGFKDYHKVSNYLKNLGYDDVTIEEVWKKLARMDLAGLTTDRVNAGYVNTADMYNGTPESEALIKTALEAMHLTESEIASVIQRHKDTWNNSEAGQEQMVSDLVTSGKDLFDPNYSYDVDNEDGTKTTIGGDGGEASMNAFIEKVWEIVTAPNAVDENGKSLFDQAAYDRAVEAWERMKTDYDGKVWDAYVFISNNIQSMGKDNVTAYLKDQNLSEAMINDAFSKYETSDAGRTAAVDTFVTNWTDKFDPKKSKDDFVNNMITKEDGTLDESQRANAEAAWEQMSSNYNTRMGEIDTLIYGLFRDDNGISTWSDSADQNAALNDFFTTQGLSEKEQQYVRDKLNERKAKQETAANQTVAKNLTDIEQKNGLLTYGDYMNASSAAEGDAKTNYQNSAAGLVKDVMNGMLELSDADEYLTGLISSEGWDDLSNDEKRRRIVDAAMKDQNMTRKDKNEIVSSYIETKTSEIIDTDKGNAKASGLADAGDLIMYVKGLGLGSATERKLIENIAGQMKFEIKNGQINWYGAVEGAEATFKRKNYAVDYRVSDKDLISNLDKNKNGKNAVYDGVLYEKIGDVWWEITVDDLQVIGDGHTNTDDQRKGIYDLLVVLLDPNVDNVTPGGDSTSGKKSNGKHGSGHSKDTYAAIK